MFENKKLIYAIFIAVIATCGILYVVLIKPEAGMKVNATNDAKESKDSTEATKPQEEIEDIYVQLCGAVVHEGVYQVSEGTRVFEIIEMAGGLKADAAVEIVNQAREAQDGELIFFPTNEAVKNGTYTTEGENALIHINTANKEQLMTLPGVGEAKALSIIQYRDTNNGFKSIEEIMEISGIKEAMFNKIKHLITL